VALKGEAGSSVGTAGFCGSYVCWVYFCCSGGACVRDCRGLGLCKIGIVGWSAGDECVGGRGSLVLGSERMAGEGECWGKEWMRRGRTSY
jgi:hypothetical protein